MATRKKRGLGKGLSALIQEVPAQAEPDEQQDTTSGFVRVPLAEIVANPYQPRKQFNAEPLEDLVSSIKERGVLQPLLVRKHRDEYQLIAGERRLRASELAGLQDVPVVVMDVTDRDALELAIIENVQREDLNVIEEAEGYQALIDQFDLTQEEVAERVGKGRASIANTLRLLGLSEYCKELIAEERLSAGHAKVLLGLTITPEQDLLAKQIAQEGLSVREVEKRVNQVKKKPKKPREEKQDIPAAHLLHLSEKLHQHLGTGVHISSCKTLANGKKVTGKVVIDYYAPDDLDRVLALLGLTEDL